MSAERMTAAQFLAKYPKSEHRNNCLQDMGCPWCGARDQFIITFHGTASVCDEGSDDVGDHEWDAESSCHCHDCGNAGSVANFTFKGLDDLILERTP